jgi:hypothetical protein
MAVLSPHKTLPSKTRPIEVDDGVLTIEGLEGVS